MKSEMRVKVLVAVAASADEHADRLRRFRGPVGRPRDTGELCRDRRHRGAVSGIVHRARQSVDPSALRQLPSGRRSSAPGRTRAGSTSRRSSAARTVMASRPCAVRSATSRPTSTPAACRVTPSGISHRVKWRGKGKTLGEICAQIKDPERNGGRSLEELVRSYRHRHSGRLGLGARIRPPARSRHAEASGRARRGVGENRGSVSELAPLHRDFDRLIFSGIGTVIDVSQRLQSLPRGFAGEGGLAKRGRGGGSCQTKSLAHFENA